MGEAKKTKSLKFNFYRYQLLIQVDPTAPKLIYQTPDKDYARHEDIVADKNDIFSKVLNSITLSWPRGDIKHEIVHKNKEVYLMRLAINRPTELRTPDFDSVTADDWPRFFIYFDNDPEHQYIAIQSNYEAFNNTSIVKNMLETGLNGMLGLFYIKVHIKPMLEYNAFWDFVEVHKEKIIAVIFDMVSPNMSSISKDSEWPLKQVKDRYNATKQKVQLENDSGTSLQLPKDPLLNSLVSYASEGGGTTKIKLKGVSGFTNLSSKTLNFTIEEVDLETDDKPALFKNIMIEIRKYLKNRKN